MPIIHDDDSFYGEGADSPDKGGSATMLSRSVLGGKEVKPGDRIILRVTKVHDDEVAVEYATKDGDDPADDETADEAPAMPEGTPAEGEPAPAENDSIYA
jgi:hypothetical protein